MSTPGLDAANAAAAAVVGPAARCPRCGSRESVPCAELQVGYEESFVATHECRNCHERYRDEPPARRQ